MRLVTKGDKATRAALEKCTRLRAMDRVPLVCPVPTPDKIQEDVLLIDAVVFSEDAP
jgi:hypothetical protein